MPRRRRGEWGSTIVEAALVLILFIMLFLCMADVARLIYAYNEMPFLAREGARYAAVHGGKSSAPLTCGAVITHMQAMAPGVVASQLTISVNGTTSSTSATALGVSPAQVTVIATYTLNPLFKWVLSGTTNVSGQSIMEFSQ
jgi:Flp pilus assembly protein TadG